MFLQKLSRRSVCVLSCVLLCGLEPARLLCPCEFLGKKTEVGCHSFSRGSFRPRDQTCVSCIDRQLSYHWATWESSISPIFIILKISGSNPCIISPDKGRIGCIWRHSWLSQSGKGLLLASIEWTPGTLLNVPPCTGQPLSHKKKKKRKKKKLPGPKYQKSWGSRILLQDQSPVNTHGCAGKVQGPQPRRAL